MKKVLSVLLVLCLCFVLAACGGEKPETAVANLLEAIKNGDNETIEKYLASEDFDSGADEVDLGEEEIAEYLFSKLTYEIKGSNVSGDTASVDVELTTLDMPAVFGSYITEMLSLAMENAFKSEGEALSEEELDEKSKQALINLMTAEDAKTVTKTVGFQLEKNEKSWRVKNSKEVADAVMGGLISALESLGDIE